MKTHESAEMYLETILVLLEKKGNVRSIDIANEMNFSKPSVSIAMKNLRSSECIEVSPDGLITLTDKGRAIAGKIYERHTYISRWLTLTGRQPRHRGGRRLPHRARHKRRDLRGPKGPCDIGQKREIRAAPQGALLLFCAIITTPPSHGVQTVLTQRALRPWRCWCEPWPRVLLLFLASWVTLQHHLVRDRADEKYEQVRRAQLLLQRAVLLGKYLCLAAVFPAYVLILGLHAFISAHYHYAHLLPCLSFDC